MYTPQQIDFIRAFGHKELTEGCLLNISHTTVVHIEMGGDVYEDNIEKEIVGRYICDAIKSNDFDFSWDSTVFNFKDFGECGESNSYEILGHTVEWHHVFAKLKEDGYKTEITIEGKLLLFRTDQGDWISLENEIPCNPCLSPMEQPALIEELLKLKP